MVDQRYNPEAGFTVACPRHLLVAFVLLLAALVAFLVKDRAVWFGSEEVSATEETINPAQPSATPIETTPVQLTPAQPAPAKAHIHSSNGATARHLSVDVVSSAHHAAKATSDALVIAPLQPIVKAAERTTIASLQPPGPTLANQTKVQGSVLLQALIGEDGVIRDLTVISGPAILSSAARTAALQWRFKPYLQNGKAVETSARITVNFVISVGNDRSPQDARKIEPSRSPSQLANPGE